MNRIQTEVTGFAEYHKIDTLFERDKETFVVNPSKIKSPVLQTISRWHVTEKIDGTNVRVMLHPEGNVQFGGRSNNAQLPGDLVQYLINKFPADLLRQVLWVDGTPVEVVLYGEGYGPGIQKGGGLYRSDKAFILFDVLVASKWWMEKDTVYEIAAKLGIEAVPYLGLWSLGDIVDYAATQRPSAIGSAMAEGIVARPIETLFDRRGERVIIKLKTKDFVAGKR